MKTLSQRKYLPLTILCLAINLVMAWPVGADEPKKARATREKWNVAIVIHDDVELLDFAGPGEVFSSAAGARAFNVYTVAETALPVKSQRFLTITPQYTIANCPKPDIVVIPGGETPRLLRSPAMMKWIRSSADNAEIMFSVCTGAFALAEAGLLDGFEATTHYSSISALKKYSKIKVREDRRVVDNGKMVTAAGVSAGIDGALHVVSRLCGLDTAKRTAKYMEYRWEPEPAKAASTPTPPSDVNANHAWFAGKWTEVEKFYQQVVDQSPADGVALYRLGCSQLRQKKLDDAVRNLSGALQNGHRDGETTVQLGLAQMRLKQHDLALKSYEQALELGFREWALYYDLAKLYALTGLKAKALTALESAFTAGMVGVEQVLLDSEFDSIRGEPRFRAVISKNCFDSRVTMVTDKEPGDRLVVSGVVRGPDGQPLPHTLVYIYHTDVKGVYSVQGFPSARLFAYLKTDGKGRYEISTIRPAGYPDSRIPQHIHFEIMQDGKPKYDGEFFFADDSRLSSEERQEADRLKMVATVTRDKDGVQRCVHDLVVSKR